MIFQLRLHIRIRPVTGKLVREKIGPGTNFPWNFYWSPSENVGPPAKVFGWNHAYIGPPAKGFGWNHALHWSPTNNVSTSTTNMLHSCK